MKNSKKQKEQMKTEQPQLKLPNKVNKLATIMNVESIEVASGSRDPQIT